MTSLLPELAAALPADLQIDGELVALDPDGRPDFHRLGRRMLHRDASIAVVYFVFDLLAVEGLATTMLPYAERRALLEELDLEGSWVRLVATFEDGAALFRVVCDRGLEGIVAKRERGPYRPGERAWIKTKNRATARFAEERDGVGRRSQQIQHHQGRPRGVVRGEVDVAARPPRIAGEGNSGWSVRPGALPPIFPGRGLPFIRGKC